jgi:pimeloyl-CoA synthetase
MTAIDLDEDRLNLEIRKFLKQVGVTSQREIEKAVRDAAASGKLSGAVALDAKMTLSIPALGLEHVIEHQFHVG